MISIYHWDNIKNIYTSYLLNVHDVHALHSYGYKLFNNK